MSTSVRATIERVIALTIHEGRQCGRWGHHFGSSRCRAFELAQRKVDHVMAAVAADKSWPSLEECRRMTPAEVNAYLASIGATVRVLDPDAGSREDEAYAAGLLAGYENALDDTKRHEVAPRGQRESKEDVGEDTAGMA
jgi:hypothetical protein